MRVRSTKIRFLVSERTDRPDEVTVQTQFGEILFQYAGPGARGRASLAAALLESRYGGKRHDSVIDEIRRVRTAVEANPRALLN